MGGRRDTGSFNLLLNPFVVLSVTPSATKEEIAEAFDDKLAQATAEEELLQDARRTLLIPNQRLAAEVSYLFDTPEKAAGLTLDRLDDPSTVSDLRSLARTLPPLSRLNMLGHIGASSCDSELLISYLDTQSQIDIQSLSKRFNRTRVAAGMPKPTADAIENALRLLVGRHCTSLLNSYSAPERAAEDIRRCVEYFLQTSPHDTDALVPLLKGYRSSIATEQSKHGIEVDLAIDTIAESPDNDSAMSALHDALHQWDRLSQPLQLFEQFMERDDPDSRAMFVKIRGVALDLANNHSAYKASLALSQLCKEVFAELPRAVEQLEDDIQVLEDMVLQSGASPLIELASKIKESPHRLAEELKLSELGNSSNGILLNLRTVFQSTVEKLYGTPSFDVPWAILRDLSLSFNNDLDDPISSLAIIEFIIRHPLFKNTSEILRSQIEEDEAAVRINVLEQDLLGAVNTKNFVAIEACARKLIPLVTDPDKKRQLSQLLQGMEQRNKPKLKIWRYLIGAAVVLMVVSSLMDQKPKSTYRPNSSASTTRPSQTEYPASIRPTVPATSPDTGNEVKPQPGTDITLTIENLRYCVREEERLDMIKPRIVYDGDKVIQIFNKDIADFNSRCSRYRYFQVDMDKIVSESVTRKKLTDDEATERLERWRVSAGAASIQPEPEPGLPASTDPQPSSETAISHAKLDPLNLEDAALIQSVLADLGYFDGPMNGTWGPKSKRALYLFKRTNGLRNDDGFDADTETRLFGDSALRFAEGDISETDHLPYVYPPPVGAKLNPLNASDAAEINMKLRELGLYKGQQLEIWSGLSRDALSTFRTSRGLPDNRPWDWQVEQQLFAIH